MLSRIGGSERPDAIGRTTRRERVPLSEVIRSIGWGVSDASGTLTVMICNELSLESEPSTPSSMLAD